MRRRHALVVAAFSAVLAGVVLGPAVATAGTEVTAWQGGPLHDGFAAEETLVPPLIKAWEVTLPEVGHALVAEGRAFVVSSEPDTRTSNGTELRALDIDTGAVLWGPVDLGGVYHMTGHTYADGRVFTVNGSGLMQAHDAATGALLWTLQLDGEQHLWNSPPTAAYGAVYVAGTGFGGTLFAVDGASGELLWEQRVSSGDHSSPVVTADSIYLSFRMGITLSIRRADGAPQWERIPNGSGGGGRTPVLHDGRLYVRDDEYGAVLDAGTGEELRPLDTDVAPAFHAGRGFFVEDEELVARGADGALLWRSGSQTPLYTAPYVAGGHVYIGGMDALHAYREADGAHVWSGPAQLNGTNEDQSNQPYDGLSIGAGMVFGSGGDTLVAWRGSSSAGPTEPPQPRSTEDACPEGEVPEDGADDVPPSSVHESSVDCVVWWEVAKGPAPGRFAPAQSLSRGQLATFLVRLMEATDAPLPPASRDHFPDDDGSVHEHSIDRLAEAGIVAGRADGRYLPDQPVSRAAMATFLVRAFEHRAGTELTGGGDWFSDDDGDTHEPAIDKAATAGFTAGTGGDRYGPAMSVRRDQMASFLARVLDLLVEQGYTSVPSQR